jgi:hypothetical protein
VIDSWIVLDYKGEYWLALVSGEVDATYLGMFAPPVEYRMNSE